MYLEAGLMKKPSIGARRTGAETIIVDNETGLLFENGDPQSLAAAIGELVENPSSARRLGAQASVHIMTHFGPDLVVEAYEGLYASLLSASHDQIVAGNTGQQART